MNPQPTDGTRTERAAASLPDVASPDGRAVLLSLAQRLQRAGVEVDVQGTVVTKSIAGSVVLHALVGAAAGLFWMAAPLVGTALAFAVAWSAYVELEGGRGWLRRWVPRDVGHNLVVWGPPGLKRQLVVCAPLDGPHRSVWADSRWYSIVLAGVALVAIGMASSVVAPAIASQVVGAGTAVLLSMALLGTMGIVAYDCATEPLGAELLSVVARLRAHPTQNVSVTLVATQGGSLTHDGIDILVRNNHHRLPRRSTRVVVLTPAKGPPSLFDPEGAWRRAPADPLLATAVRSLGAGVRRGVSAASRVARAGFTGIGVAGEIDGAWIESMIRSLDAASLSVIEKR
jgi:hypothetical protein